MCRIGILGVFLAVSLTVLSRAQPDPQTALWMRMKQQLSGSDGERYFEGNLKGTAMPVLKGTLASALINPGVSRLILKMPGSAQPEVTLIVHSDDIQLEPHPAPGRTIEFSGVGAAFTPKPFMLTFDVDIEDLHGLALVRPESNRPAKR